MFSVALDGHCGIVIPAKDKSGNVLLGGRENIGDRRGCCLVVFNEQSPGQVGNDRQTHTIEGALGSLGTQHIQAVWL